MAHLEPARLYEQDSFFSCVTGTCAEPQSSEPDLRLVNKFTGITSCRPSQLVDRSILALLCSEGYCRIVQEDFGSSGIEHSTMTSSRFDFNIEKIVIHDPTIMPYEKRNEEPVKTKNLVGTKITLKQACQEARKAIKQANRRYKKAVEWEAERGFLFEDA